MWTVDPLYCVSSLTRNSECLLCYAWKSSEDEGQRPECALIDLALGHDPWSCGLGTERKGLVPENLVDQSSERRNLRGFLIE